MFLRIEITDQIKADLLESAKDFGASTPSEVFEGLLMKHQATRTRTRFRRINKLIKELASV